MKHPDVNHAVTSRGWGLRRVRNLTWGIAGAGAVGAVVLAVGFGDHAHQSQTSRPSHRGEVQAPADNQNAPGDQAGQDAGQLQPPQENPAPVQGPGQVVSGGS